jgi:hypothetical protein
VQEQRLRKRVVVLEDLGSCREEGGEFRVWMAVADVRKEAKLQVN